jgi:hypothetical protein
MKHVTHPNNVALNLKGLFQNDTILMLRRGIHSELPSVALNLFGMNGDKPE